MTSQLVWTQLWSNVKLDLKPPEHIKCKNKIFGIFIVGVFIEGVEIDATLRLFNNY